MTGVVVGLTQRVALDPRTGERRDALDQRWTRFLAACGFVALPLPNHPEASLALLDRLRPVGAVLTGGGDLAAYGGDSPERDDTEARLLDLAFAGYLPVIGVCRGMQAIQHRCGVPLEPVDSHVATTHPLHGEGRAVNSFHAWGARTSAPALIVRARAKDGVVEAVEHREAPVRGVMWHPERVEPFDAADIALFRAALGGVR